MSSGGTVVLLHLDEIYDSLYDVLNQRYLSIDDKNYCNIAINDSEILCQIHPAFRIIIMMPRSYAHHTFKDKSKHTPVAFLNRLEKQYLNISELNGLSKYFNEIEEKIEIELQELFKAFFSSGSNSGINSINSNNSGIINYSLLFAGFMQYFTFKSLLVLNQDLI